MGTRFDTEMKKLGFRIVKRTFSFGHFPFLVSIVEWTKSDAEMLVTRMPPPGLSHRAIEFVDILDPFEPRKDLDYRYQLEFKLKAEKEIEYCEPEN